MYKMKNILSILLVMMMFIFLTVPGALPVFAADTTDTAAATDTAASTDTAAAGSDTAAAAVTTAAAKPIVISDTSNIIGIVVAVILGVGAVALIVILAPKNTAPKKK